MSLTLALLRHGRASGQGPEAGLLPEGAAYVATLGRRLAREGFSPVAAFGSPYVRAQETARIVLGELASDLVIRRLPELMPDEDVGRALDALLALAPPAGCVLVVSHMPLLGRLTRELTGETPEFHPGTLVEIGLEATRRRGSVTRRIGPGDL